MFHSVQFGDFDSMNQWGLYLNKPPEISPPEVNTYMVDVPGMNGGIDLTDSLTGRPTYKTREIAFTFLCIRPRSEWQKLHGEMLRAIHGRRMKISLSSDPEYYYEGRVFIDDWGTDVSKTMEFPKVTAIVNPYKLCKEETVYEIDFDSFVSSEVVVGGGKNVSIMPWNVDLRFGNPAMQTCDWSVFEKLDFEIQAYANYSIVIYINFADADGRNFGATIPKTENTEETLHYTFTPEMSNLDWSTIWRFLFSNAANVKITGKTIPSVVRILRRSDMPVVPIIDTMVPIKLTANGKTFEMDAGTHQFPDFLVEEETDVIITSTTPGSVVIRYRRGAL